jgi:hypothetical protein
MAVLIFGKHAVWNNIRPTLIDFMQVARVNRLKVARIDACKKRTLMVSELLAEYRKTRPYDEIIPKVADVVCMAAFRSTIIDTPIATTVTPESFAEAMGELPRLTQQWRATKERELVVLMNPKNPLNNTSESVEDKDNLRRLELATTFFECSCREPISYPRVLEHFHMSLLKRVADEDNELAEVFQAVDHQPWNYGGACIAFHSVAHNATRSIVETCGLDPDKATARDMDEGGHMLECMHCSFPVGRCAMRWRRAVRRQVFR